MRNIQDEEIAKIPNELPRDAVGVWQIVPKGQQTFGLRGAELECFLRRAILALLDAGGVPVRHLPGSQFDWTYQPQYGEDHGNIADAVIAEWKTLQDQTDTVEMIEKCPWFARPDPRFSRFVDMAVRE